MNQSIQFPDTEYWDADKQAVYFPALVNGFQVWCAVSGGRLEQASGTHSPDACLDAFRAWRWDLEDEAEQCILQDRDDDQGVFWLS